MIRTTVWPRSWNSRSLRSTTVWPEVDVGRPSGRSRASRAAGAPPRACARAPPSGARRPRSGCRNRAASAGDSVMGPMLDCRARRTMSAPASGRSPDLALSTPAADPPGPHRYAGTPLRSPSSHHAAPTPACSAPTLRQRAGGGPAAAKPKLKKLRLALVLLGLAVARAGLDGLRDDDGGRQRPAAAREPAPSTARAATRRCSPPTASTRIAKLTGNENRILVARRRDLAEHQERGDRHRGPPLLRARGVDYAGIGRALWQDMLQAARRRAPRRSRSSS